MASEPLFIQFSNWYEAQQKTEREASFRLFGEDEIYLLWVEEVLGLEKAQSNRKIIIESIKENPKDRKACEEIYAITSQLYRIFANRKGKQAEKLWEKLISVILNAPAPGTLRWSLHSFLNFRAIVSSAWA